MGFQNIYSKNLPGMLDYAGNTLGLNGACTTFSNITTGCNSPGTSGICGAWMTTDKTKYASSNWLSFVNGLPYSPNTGGTTFNCTQNSSSDIINIPVGTTLDYAVLIWCGNSASNTVDVSTRAITLIDPTNVSHTITPKYSSVNSSIYGYYTCANDVDVTNIVRNAGNGYYTVGNVYSEFQTNLASAGWLLVVVYTAPVMGYANININIGNLDVSGDASASATLSGFETKPDGELIKAGLILTALNGNPASSGDQVSLTNNNNVPTYLYGTYNPVDNFFGAQIEDITSNIDQMGTFANLNATPNAIQSTPGRRMGFDIALVNAAPALSNNQSSTVLTGSTSGNNYSITSAISIVEDTYPFFNINVSTSETNVLLGNSYTLTYTIENIGSLSTDTLDFTFDDTGLGFVYGSYTISGSTHNILANPNALSLPNIGVGETMTINLTYNANEIPDELYYKNLDSLHYTFTLNNETIENTLQKTSAVDISSIKILTTTNVNPVSTTIPLINPTSTNITYSIGTEPTYGTVILNQNTITYIPSTLQQISDKFVIKITNNTSEKFISLIYTTNEIVVPILSLDYNKPDTLNLFSSVDIHYTVTNHTGFDITNSYAQPILAPGLLLPEATINDPQGQPIDMIRTANKYTVGTINANSSITFTYTYEAAKLPTDLIYAPAGIFDFDFGGLHFSKTATSPGIIPIANIDLTIPNNEIFSEYIPIIENDYQFLSYSIKTQGSLGTASVSSTGLLTYTPQTYITGNDIVVITISNSQQNTTLDVNYAFDIVNPGSVPCPQEIPYKLVHLLNNDIYLMGLEGANISENVCFDCSLWNSGYTSSTGVLLIPPIKTSLISILTTLSTDLQNTIMDTNSNIPCNNAAFKSQVDRLLSIVNDLISKFNILNCSNDNCNITFLSSFLTLLSQTLDGLITITSTLNGLSEICHNNCSVCTSYFDNLMGIFINSITDLSNFSVSWSYLVMNSINNSTSIPKSYVPVYAQPTSIKVKPYKYNNGFICPPKHNM